MTWLMLHRDSFLCWIRIFDQKNVWRSKFENIHTFWNFHPILVVQRSQTCTCCNLKWVWVQYGNLVVKMVPVVSSTSSGDQNCYGTTHHDFLHEECISKSQNQVFLWTQPQAVPWLRWCAEVLEPTKGSILTTRLPCFTHTHFKLQHVQVWDLWTTKIGWKFQKVRMFSNFDRQTFFW